MKVSGALFLSFVFLTVSSLFQGVDGSFTESTERIIGNGMTATIPIEVSGIGAYSAFGTDFQVDILLDDFVAGDLVMTLEAPSGEQAIIVTMPTDGLGSCTSVTFYALFLRDTYTDNVQTQCPMGTSVVAGNFRPGQLFDDQFTGATETDVDGTWKLIIEDKGGEAGGFKFFEVDLRFNLP